LLFRRTIDAVVTFSNNVGFSVWSDPPDQSTSITTSTVAASIDELERVRGAEEFEPNRITSGPAVAVAAAAAASEISTRDGKNVTVRIASFLLPSETVALLE
jgi:hypothetical protein